MKKNKALIEIAFILLIVFFLLALSLNILKDSEVFNPNVAIKLLYLAISFCGMYYFYSVGSKLRLSLCFGLTRKELFKNSVKNGILIGVLVFVLELITYLLYLVFNSKGITLKRLFLESDMLLLCTFYFASCFIGLIASLININKVVKNILMILLFIAISLLIATQNLYIVLLQGVVDLALFIIAKDMFYNKNLD